MPPPAPARSFTAASCNRDLRELHGTHTTPSLIHAPTRIRVNFGASEAGRRANDHTREELRDWQNMVADMRRQLLSLGERLARLEQKPAP